MGLLRLTPSLVGLIAIGSACLLTTRPASAQTISVTAASLERKVGFRPSSEQPTWINYSDCVKDDELSFETILQNALGKSLEVWAGSNTDCTVYDARQSASAPTCWQVYKASAQGTTQKVVIRAQDIVAQHLKTASSSGPGSGTAADCDRTDIESAGVPVTLHFLLIDSAGQASPSTGTFTYPTQFDLVGPAAPSGVSAGVGEDRLIVDWNTVNATDLLGYRLYCDPKPGSVTPANQPMATGGAAGADGASGASGATGAGGAAGADASTDASSGGSDAGTDAGGDAGGAAGSGTDGGSGTGGNGGNPNCPSTALVPGDRPNGAYQCGSVTTKAGGPAEATGLVNGVVYAVAVAAVDTVGNSGPLSQVACGTPQPVNDFFELYRQAGGKGGGGFCALGADPKPGAAWLLGIALGALAIRRRRRPR
jgi:hypothetical protein